MNMKSGNWKIVLCFALIILLFTLIFGILPKKCEKDPNAEGCVCDEYEMRQRVNYSVLDNVCIPFNLTDEKQTISFSITTEEQIIKEDEMYAIQKYAVDKSIEEKGIIGTLMDGPDAVNIQRPLRDVQIIFKEVVNIKDNSSSSVLCFEFGGEYKDVEIDGELLKHTNISNLYYYEQSNHCLNAHWEVKNE